MRKNTTHIHGDALTTLQRTAERMGSELEEVIAAAIGAFAQQDAVLRSLVVEDYCLRSMGLSRSQAQLPSVKEKIHELVRRLFATFRRCVAHAVAG
jgi:hypothetical protein